MIKYRFTEEKQIVLHYAKALGDQKTIHIINAGVVSSSEEAIHLSRFFWKMVDLSVADIDNGVTVCGKKDLEAWNEYIMDSIRSYLRKSGYSKEWEEQSDLA
ncbi:hypothetical protein [Hahella ganghwensis]|uniref:hypothetical protein n=1 Tax=Hahella ganghwensis TaxID=286420 RepID=UPI00035E3F3A|nr:hypothetical protein [Hahella ganghwensis]